MVKLRRDPGFDEARGKEDSTLDEKFLWELWHPQEELEELEQKFPGLLEVSAATLVSDERPHESSCYGTLADSRPWGPLNLGTTSVKHVDNYPRSVPLMLSTNTRLIQLSFTSTSYPLINDKAMEKH